MGTTTSDVDDDFDTDEGLAARDAEYQRLLLPPPATWVCPHGALGVLPRQLQQLPWTLHMGLSASRCRQFRERVLQARVYLAHFYDRAPRDRCEF